MQRHPALRSLTSEHHTGLVLARRARKAAREGARAQSVAWKEVTNRFRSELEGHFRREERGLLPVLRQHPSRFSGGIDHLQLRVGRVLKRPPSQPVIIGVPT